MGARSRSTNTKGPQPSLADALQKAISLLPELSDDDISSVLGARGKKLDAPSRYEIRGQLNEALRDYVRARIWESGAAAVTPSARAKRLNQLAEKTRRVVQARGAEGDPLSESIRSALLGALADRGQEVTTLFGVPVEVAGDGTAVGEDASLASVGKDATQRRGLTGLEQLALLERLWNAVDLLNNVARTAYETERRRIAAKAPDRDRHRADEGMQALFFGLNEIWMKFFRKLPGVTWDEYHRKFRGPYVQFVECVLHRYADRVPDALEGLAPGLRRRLRLTRPAIHSHFRETGVSSLRHALRDQGLD
jgi:hypothetical protein